MFETIGTAEPACVYLPGVINRDPHADGFRSQPTGHVTALFDDLDGVRSALRALAEAGFDKNQSQVYVGESGAHQLDLSGDHHGLRARFSRWRQQLLGDESSAFAQMDEALRAGHAVVAVPIDGSAREKDTVTRVMRSHGAYAMHFYGRFTLEDLV